MASRPTKNFYRAKTNATHLKRRERRFPTLEEAEDWIDRHRPAGPFWHWEDGEWVVVLDLPQEHPADIWKKEGNRWVQYDCIAKVCGVDDDDDEDDDDDYGESP